MLISSPALRTAKRLQKTGLTTFLNQLRELREEVAGIVRARCGFGMILDAEDRQFAMPHALHGAVIQIDVRDLHFFRQRIRIHRESVILRGDRNLAGSQILHWLIPTAMPEL